METGRSPAGLAAFLSSRDFLLATRDKQLFVAERFAWPDLNAFNWSLDYFDTMALNNNKPALWIVDEDGSECQRSFHEMSRRSAQVANFLRRVGVRRGDRILVVLGNEVAPWECMLGAFKLGAVVIPATVLLTEDDLHDRLTRGQVGHVIATSSVVAKFARLPGSYTRVCVGPTQSGWLAFAESVRESPTFDADGSTSATDPLLLYFTSGTTSKPKVVQHTHQSYPVGHLSTMYWLGLMPGDLHLNVSSPGWAKHAWSSFFAPWNAAACTFIYNIQRFNAASLLRTIASHGVTTLCAPPTVWRLIIQEDLSALRDHIKLREVTSAGEPLNPEVIAQVHEAWGLTLRDGFGQTETTALIGNAPGQPVKPGSMGRVLPGYHVTLINSDGRERAEGEICVKLKPVGLMTHYLDDEARTTAALRDGYYHTGDIATRDEDGYVTFVGRVDDVFKSSDYRISPFELESILVEHEAVSEAAVVPSPDPVRLAVPKAFVTLVKGQSASRDLALDLLAFAQRRLAPYKRVRRVEFVTELPKTISGKIRRIELRKLEAERRLSAVRVQHEYGEEDFPSLKKASETQP